MKQPINRELQSYSKETPLFFINFFFFFSVGFIQKINLVELHGESKILETHLL